MDLTTNDIIFLFSSYLFIFPEVCKDSKIVEVACLNIISQLMDLATNDTAFSLSSIRKIYLK